MNPLQEITRALGLKAYARDNGELARQYAARGDKAEGGIYHKHKPVWRPALVVCPMVLLSIMAGCAAAGEPPSTPTPVVLDAPRTGPGTEQPCSLPCTPTAAPQSSGVPSPLPTANLTFAPALDPDIAGPPEYTTALRTAIPPTLTAIAATVTAYHELLGSDGAINLPCMPSFPQLPPLPVDTGEPALTPTPVRFTPTPTPHQAPSITELRATLDKRYGQMANPACSRDSLDAAGAHLDYFWRSLIGRRAQGWEGWVVRSPSDRRYSPPKEWHIPGAGDPNAILLLMDDPYPDQVPVQPRFTLNLGIYSLPRYFLLSGTDVSPQTHLLFGQKVRFSGMLEEPPIDPYNGHNRFGFRVVDATLAAEAPLPTPTAASADLQQVTISLERGPCFGSCPLYKVTIYGNGMVVFEGKYWTNVLGYRISTISADTVRRLIAQFEESGFFSMQDSYIKQHRVLSEPPPPVTTSIMLPGRSKTVIRVDDPPEALVQLEKAIDAAANTAPWVSPPSP